jgi:selenide,water dikinase
LSILSEILRGGAEKVREAGAVIAGGHTVTDQEPKYGLAVTGVVHPGAIIAKGGAQPGDRLLLTKALGTGVITTALKQGKARAEHVDLAITGMSRLNRGASRLARQFGVHAMTDITGYSLPGHGHEMAHLSGVDLHIEFGSLEWLPGARDYGEQGIFPGGTGRNRAYFNEWIYFDEGVTEVEQQLLFDPQTSGGLLMAVSADKAQDLHDNLNQLGDLARLIGDVSHGTGCVYIHT